MYITMYEQKEKIFFFSFITYFFGDRQLVARVNLFHAKCFICKVDSQANKRRILVHQRYTMYNIRFWMHESLYYKLAFHPIQWVWKRRLNFKFTISIHNRWRIYGNRIMYSWHVNWFDKPIWNKWCKRIRAAILYLWKIIPHTGKFRREFRSTLDKCRCVRARIEDRHPAFSRTNHLALHSRSNYQITSLRDLNSVRDRPTSMHVHAIADTVAVGGGGYASGAGLNGHGHPHHQSDGHPLNRRLSQQEQSLVIEMTSVRHETGSRPDSRLQLDSAWHPDLWSSPSLQFASKAITQKMQYCDVCVRVYK